MNRPPMIPASHRVRRADADTNASPKRTPDAIESHVAPGHLRARPSRGGRKIPCKPS